MNLEQFVRMLHRQSEGRKTARSPQLQLFEEDVLDNEEDMGALRLLRLQAALKERRFFVEPEE